MIKAYSETIERKSKKEVNLEEVHINGELFFKISNYDKMRPFFMSVVSDANHWMFIASNGGLSAGRKNPEYALFPYYTVDKIMESADHTGPKTIFQIHLQSETIVWAPFSERFTHRYDISRNLYKSVYGNQIIFEETNHDLGLTFRYRWSFSRIYGFVRKSELVNHSDSVYKITLLDGLLNILPFGVPSDLQEASSNLVDAYKRSELDADTGLGIFSLSAIIVDRAEPSEALKANVAWSLGLDNPQFLLSAQQLNTFRSKGGIHEESDIKGEKGAYLVSADIHLSEGQKKEWKILANVNQSAAQITNLIEEIKSDPDSLKERIDKDVQTGTANLIRLVAASDGFQLTDDKLNDSRHYSNVLFNIMRGGTFDWNYQIPKSDFLDFIRKANKGLYRNKNQFLNNLPDNLNRSVIHKLVREDGDPDLIRLGMEYLPLKFSRRHGDPSRPWNYFTINTQDENTGADILDYEGNWRDIFQNWEALAYSYPEFIAGMIFKFLNASTFDGYNPYRLTKDGFDWETIEPDNPWSYIGYWGDHQIIYLLKFLEITDRFYPGTLQSWFDKDWFVYAAVPYKIKAYNEILKNSKDTIDFDLHWDERIRNKRKKLGADGSLLTTDKGNIYRVNFIEKLLASVLAKLSNFIPEGGIWMNTQRPEWNDANNALVGNGVSMVTLYYLHRFFDFFLRILEESKLEHVKISSELIEFYHSVREVLSQHRDKLESGFSDSERKALLDQLGRAASDYRLHIYKTGFWGKKRSSSLEGLKTFACHSLDFIRQTIAVNQRADKLYHAYNLVKVDNQKLKLSHLSEMLEGQVAVLSSGHLSSVEALEVLDALKKSALFRDDQYSYVLYPDKDLPGFLDKNTIPSEEAGKSRLIEKLIAEGDTSIVEIDVNGQLYFNGNFRNAKDLEVALDELAEVSRYSELVESERDLMLDLFEKVFNHLNFTGRSGTFFAYEGLGSIYWHMVSKLHLAIQEVCIKAVKEKADSVTLGKLLEHYYEIEAGIGSHKSPELYGAFPTDPYSHTPLHRGAQQPGMTGQVKEDIILRFGELGIEVENGSLKFNNHLLRKSEFLTEEKTYRYFDLNREEKKIQLSKGQLAFTFCNVPTVYSMSSEERITVHFSNGKTGEVSGTALNKELSRSIFARTGKIDRLEVHLKIIR